MPTPWRSSYVGGGPGLPPVAPSPAVRQAGGAEMNAVYSAKNLNLVLSVGVPRQPTHRDG